MKTFKNELFEQFKVRCEIEFMNKSKNYSLYHEFKHVLINKFSEIKITNKDASDKSIFFINYIEATDSMNIIENTTATDSHFKLFVSTLDNENKTKIINNYRLYVNLQQLEKRPLSSLLLLSEGSNTDETLNIEYLDFHAGNNCLEELDKLLRSKLDSLYELTLIEMKDFESKLDSLKRNKNHYELRDMADKWLVLGEYKKAMMVFQAMIEVFNKTNDALNVAKAREGNCLCNFIIDYTNYSKNEANGLKYSNDFESVIESSYLVYKKLKIFDLAINATFKLVYYNMLFENKVNKILELLKRIYDDQETLGKSNKLNNLFKMTGILDTIGYKRKAGFYLTTVIVY
jgi:hypothetical protein